MKTFISFLAISMLFAFTVGNPVEDLYQQVANGDTLDKKMLAKVTSIDELLGQDYDYYLSFWGNKAYTIHGDIKVMVIKTNNYVCLNEYLLIFDKDNKETDILKIAEGCDRDGNDPHRYIEYEWKGDSVINLLKYELEFNEEMGKDDEEVTIIQYEIMPNGKLKKIKL